MQMKQAKQCEMCLRNHARGQCCRCWGYGHATSRCPTGGGSSNETGGKRCMACRTENHTVAECWFLDGWINRAAAMGMQAPDGLKLGARYCFACFEAGHTLVQCSSWARAEYLAELDLNALTQRHQTGHWVEADGSTRPFAPSCWTTRAPYNVIWPPVTPLQAAARPPPQQRRVPVPLRGRYQNGMPMPLRPRVGQPPARTSPGGSDGTNSAVCGRGRIFGCVGVCRGSRYGTINDTIIAPPPSREEAQDTRAAAHFVYTPAAVSKRVNQILVQLFEQ
uniref:CCHC-type domain-containing protein n=1 Tax=Globodera rostochiensis TaxID=31243 RepID=A0A914GY53_GLORO